VRAYHRVDPLMDERKGHYTPAQFGAFLKVQLVAGRQTKRGHFRSVAALKALLPSSYVRHVDFLVAEGDLDVSRSGAVYVDGWDQWQEGDLTVRDRMAALRNRRRNASVTSTVTPAVTEPSPTATRYSTGVSVGSKGSPKRLNTPRATTGEPLLTKVQLEAWKSFDREWDDFKEAWLGRGFLFPPFGEPDDDDTSQRGLLWSILDARPKDLVRWVREAPGSTANEVIGYIIGNWHTVRDEAEPTVPVITANGPNRRGPAERVDSILPRVVA
jgi:hypothetical protein